MNWISKSVCDRLEREWRMIDPQRPTVDHDWEGGAVNNDKPTAKQIVAKRLRIGRVD